MPTTHIASGGGSVTEVELAEARTAWDAFDAACAGLLASACRRHAPYMGCPLDCTDVENRIGDEFRALAPLVPALITEVTRLRALLVDATEIIATIHASADDDSIGSVKVDTSHGRNHLPYAVERWLADAAKEPT